MNNRGFGRNIWRMIYPLLIYYVLAGVIGYLALYAIVIKDTWHVFAELPLDSTYADIQEMLQAYMTTEAMLHYQQVYVKYYSYVQLAIDGCMLPVACIFFWLDRKKDSKSWHTSMEGIHWYLTPLLAGFAVCLLGNLGISMFFQTGTGGSASEALLTGLADTNGAGTLEQIQNSKVFQFFVLCVLSPIVEELLFRGIIYKRIREWRGVFTALIWSSLIYAFNYGSMMQIIYAVFVGVSAAYLYERFRNILVSVIFHCGLNLLSLFIEDHLVKVNQLLGSDARVIICMLFCTALLAFIFILIRYYVHVEGDNNNEAIDNNSSVL